MPNSTILRHTLASAGEAKIDWRSALRATLRSLKRAAQDRQGGVRSGGNGVFRVRGHPDTLQRVESFIVALVVAAKLRGYRVRQMPEGLGLDVDGEPVTFEVYQVIKRTRHVPSAAEEARLERWTRRYGSAFDPKAWRVRPEIPEWDFTPTGEMKVDIGGWPRPTGPTHVFADGRTGPIEERIPEMLETFASHATFQLTRRADAETRDAYVELRKQQLRQAQFHAGLEAERVAYLTGKIEILRRRNDLRHLLQVFGTEAGEAPATRFLAWAQAHLTSLEESLSQATVVQETREMRAFDHNLDAPEGE